MHSTWIRPIPSRPWGRKRFLLPLPILSLLLLGTALAAPGLLRMEVSVFEDENLVILASVQNVVHPDGPEGKLIGLMTVTNLGSTATRLTIATVRIQSLGDDGLPDGRIDTTISINEPRTIRAGMTMRIPFSGPFEGSVLSLRFGDSFSVEPTITWFSVPDAGAEEGPFTYAEAKTCTIENEGTPLPTSVWTVTTVCR